MPAGEGLLHIRSVGGHGLGRGVLKIFEKSADIVPVAENPVVAELGLKIDLPVAAAVGSLAHLDRLVNPVEEQGAVKFAVALCLPELRHLVAANLVVVVGVESEAADELEPFGDELEVLREGEVGLDAVPPLLGVSGLGGADPRIDLHLGVGLVADLHSRIEPVGINCRNRNRSLPDEGVPNLRRRRARLVKFLIHTAHTHLEKGRRGYVHVRVHTVVPLLVVGVGVVAALEVLVDIVHTALVEVAGGKVVARVLAAAVDVDRAAVAHRPVLHQELHPVGVRKPVGVCSGRDDSEFLACVVRLLVSGRESLVHHLRVSHSVGELRRVGARVIDCLELGVDVYLSLITALGGDEHDAVRTARAVNGRLGSVLEHGEGLDVLNVELVQVALEAIHEHKRA